MAMEWRARLPRAEDITQPVHDGDSLWLETDQGDWYRKVRDIRLRGVYAPELSQHGGRECREFVLRWLILFGQGKWPFLVTTHQTGAGRDILTFNRFVCDVANKDRSSSLNDAIRGYVEAEGFGGGIGG